MSDKKSNLPQYLNDIHPDTFLDQFDRLNKELASLREQLNTSWKEVNKVGSENDSLNSELSMMKDQLKQKEDENRELKLLLKRSMLALSWTDEDRTLINKLLSA